AAIFSRLSLRSRRLRGASDGVIRAGYRAVSAGPTSAVSAPRRWIGSALWACPSVDSLDSLDVFGTYPQDAVALNELAALPPLRVVEEVDPGLALGVLVSVGLDLL